MTELEAKHQWSSQELARKLGIYRISVHGPSLPVLNKNAWEEQFRDQMSLRSNKVWILFDLIFNLNHLFWIPIQNSSKTKFAAANPWNLHRNGIMTCPKTSTDYTATGRSAWRAGGGGGGPLHRGCIHETPQPAAVVAAVLCQANWHIDLWRIFSDLLPSSAIRLLDRSDSWLYLAFRYHICIPVTYFSLDFDIRKSSQFIWHLYLHFTILGFTNKHSKFVLLVIASGPTGFLGYFVVIYRNILPVFL